MAYGSPSLLSDRGRAWLGSVEHVSPQEIPAHAEMAAKTGLMSFQDALMIKQMADQIRASGKNEGVPPNNVMQEKLAMLSGRPAPQPQQMPPQQQMAPPQQQMPPQPQPEQDPRMQAGLGAIPAPVMDNAQYADGGIVAFSGKDDSYVHAGGSTGKWEDPKEERSWWDYLLYGNQGNPSESEEAAPATAPPTTPPPPPPNESVTPVPNTKPSSSNGIGSISLRSNLKPFNPDTEFAKEDYSAYDRWINNMQVDPAEVAKQKAEDRRQALIMFGAKMAQASKDNDFFGAFGAGAEEYGKRTSESEKERRAAEKESKIARMNLDIGQGNEKRAGLRALREAGRNRDALIAQDERQRMAIAVSMQGNAIQERAANAQIAAARLGLPVKVAQAIGALTKNKFEALVALQSTERYRRWAKIAQDEEGTPKGTLAANEIARMEKEVTGPIDERLISLQTAGQFPDFSATELTGSE